MWNRRILNINNWTCEHLAARNQHITQDDVAKAKRIINKRNLGKVSTVEMAMADDTILEVMLEKILDLSPSGEGEE